jgi:thiamine-monophosphate kinase
VATTDGAAQGERAALELLAGLLPHPSGRDVWFGDDAAVLSRPSGERLLFATDCVVAGVHFDDRWSSVADAGWKVMSANVSDIAAMGGTPIAAVVAVAGPIAGELEALYGGLLDAAVHYGCPLVGGDLSAGSELVISIAVLGTAEDPAPVLRSGAHAGEPLFVTGALGASAAGLRALRADPASTGELARAHRRPVARLAEGRCAARAGATAMIDVSDGLGLDLDRLAVASRIGLSIDDVPVAPGATLEEALAGGEDYELVFAADDRQRVIAAFADAGLRAPIEIGRCSDDPGERRLGDGALAIAGFEHHLGSSPRP